jgi:hypothetical protein
MSEQIGPSMSTEPGWMASQAALLYYFGNSAGVAANDPSMLLSFERPAPAAGREDTSQNDVTDMRGDRTAYTPLHGP